jgi:rhodanese-related sulfurtransferase
MTAPRRRGMHAALAGTALVLGAMAAASSAVSSRSAGSHPDEVTALELARWIRDARPALRVVDLRDAESFEAFRIPGADRMSPEDLVRARWEPNATVVVYADNALAAQRAQQALRIAGVRNAWVLKGGVGEWVNTIASPMLPANPTPVEAAASREIAEMSRWFGGVPRVGEARVTTGDSLRAALGRIRRRGC